MHVVTYSTQQGAYFTQQNNNVIIDSIHILWAIISVFLLCPNHVPSTVRKRQSLTPLPQRLRGHPIAKPIDLSVRVSTAAVTTIKDPVQFNQSRLITFMHLCSRYVGSFAEEGRGHYPGQSTLSRSKHQQQRNIISTSEST